MTDIQHSSLTNESLTPSMANGTPANGTPANGNGANGETRPALSVGDFIQQAPRGAQNWRDFLPPARAPDKDYLPRLDPASAPTTWPEFLLYGDPIPNQPDIGRMYRDNQARVRQELARRDLAGVVLYDPLNIRYVSATRNMSVWTLHNAARYCFLPTEGPCVMFDFHNCGHLSAGLDTVQETRGALSWYYFAAGTQAPARARAWAEEIADLLRTHGGGNRRLAFDHLDPLGAHALEALGVEIEQGQAVLEHCRARKSADELSAIRRAVQVCEAGVAALQDAITPGATENQVWGRLHEVNIANDGEWVETRLMAAGQRTNPWFQECSNYAIQAGDLVSLDTDLVGPYGYCVDMSRSFVCQGKPATDEQKACHDLALAQIRHNLDLLRPGVTAREIAERGYQLPEDFLPNRYSVVMHGVGMADEWPHIGYKEDIPSDGSEEEITLEEGMTLCVESYAGRQGGACGVKLEEQVLIGKDGPIALTSYPYSQELLGPAWV